MKILKTFLKLILLIKIIPIIYLIVSLILSSITIDRKIKNLVSDNSIYLYTNGIHLNIVMPIENIDSALLFGLKINEETNYLSFGWGDENFYLNTPTWKDLTFKTTFNALFLRSTTLMHVNQFKLKRSNWIEIKVNYLELQKLNKFIQNTFKTDENGMKIILENQGYTLTDNFYKAKGSYSFLNTCNTWVNNIFKSSGLKSCFWTPFDFGLINKYD